MRRCLQIDAASGRFAFPVKTLRRSEEHTSELQSRLHLVCRLLLEKKKTEAVRADGLALTGVGVLGCRLILGVTSRGLDVVPTGFANVAPLGRRELACSDSAQA